MGIHSIPSLSCADSLGLLSAVMKDATRAARRVVMMEQKMVQQMAL